MIKIEFYIVFYYVAAVVDTLCGKDQVRSSGESTVASKDVPWTRYCMCMI